MIDTLWDRLEREPKFKKPFDDYNAELGHALGHLPEQPQDIQGRSEEIALLHAILERPHTAVALLLGEAGVGKTALVEQFTKDLNSGKLETKTNNIYLVVAVRVGKLASIGNNKLQSALANLFDRLSDFEKLASEVLNEPNLKVVAFIDEVHMIVTIFGPGTKIGGDVIKDTLARSPIRVIAATTRREFDSTIAVDKPLSERFKQIEMNELDLSLVETICTSWWAKVAPDLEPPSDEIIHTLIQANHTYRSDSAEPRKSLDVLEDLVSYGRRTGLRVDKSVLADIFRQRWNIQIDFRVNADFVYAEIEKRIIGQPHALWVMRRLLRTMMFQLDPFTNRPMATALMTGATGSGKTETTKAIADSLYPGQPVLLNINIPDYKESAQEPDFRKRIGEYVRHTPNAIILLDELEKGSPALLDSLLAILDEGRVVFSTTNREGREEVNQVSLRNTIVIATTNQGSDVFDDDARYSVRSDDLNDQESPRDKADISNLMNVLRDNLKSAGFRPELLGRFDRIVPYRGLAERTLLRITERALHDLATKFKATHDIELVYDEPKQWPSDRFDYWTFDVALFIAMIRASADDPSRGGARLIQREVKSEVQDTVIDAVIENPGFTRFHVGVSENSSLYTEGAMHSEGEVIVKPLD